MALRVSQGAAARAGRRVCNAKTRKSGALCSGPFAAAQGGLPSIERPMAKPARIARCDLLQVKALAHQHDESRHGDPWRVVLYAWRSKLDRSPGSEMLAHGEKHSQDRRRNASNYSERRLVWSGSCCCLIPQDITSRLADRNQRKSHCQRYNQIPERNTEQSRAQVCQHFHYPQVSFRIIP
jgi:hypothetical protein